jgi:hypothetical protein
MHRCNTANACDWHPSFLVKPPQPVFAIVLDIIMKMSSVSFNYSGVPHIPKLHLYASSRLKFILLPFNRGLPLLGKSDTTY